MGRSPARSGMAPATFYKLTKMPTAEPMGRCVRRTVVDALIQTAVAEESTSQDVPTTSPAPANRAASLDCPG